MDFDIYVLGDVRLFADTLNGIAMMFKVASGDRIDLWASNTNAFGLGMGAFLGMLLGLLLLLYNAAFKQRFDFRAIIMPLVLYICLTVPKVTVNVIDAYYRDGAQTVANVPIGLAFPMSAISSIAFTATQKIETVFQVPNNGSFTKITEDGFVMPLKLLHAMRYTGLTMRDAYPNVTDSLAEVVKICLTNNDTFDELQYQSSPRSMTVFYSALNDPIAGNRLVKIFPTNKPEGEIVRCSTAAHEIEIAINGYINGYGGSANTLISSEALAVKNLRTDLEKILASNNGNTGSRNLTNISAMRVLDDIQAMTSVGNDDALNFVAATVFNPQLSTATECVVSNDNRATARCFSYATASEQWKEKSAAEASGFLSIMRDGQNLLILLSVTLFPIMVLIIVLQGMGGFKVVMSYLLYTISAYMWIPVAAMINYYTQVQLDDELKKWASRIPAGTDVAAAYLSLANAPLFYDAISKKLALANSVMASVPMICMGLFGGMLMTMNRLADKMNPQAGFKPSTNTPPVVERGALAKVGSSVSFDGLNATGKHNALPDLQTYSRARESALQSQKAQTHLDSASVGAARAYTEAISKKLMTSDTATLARQMTKMVGFEESNTESFQAAQQSMKQGISMLQISHKLNSKQELTDQESKELNNALGFDASGAVKKGQWASIMAKAEQTGLMAIAQTIGNGVGKGLDVNKVNQTLGTTGESWQTTSMSAQKAMAVATSALIATTTKAAQESESLTNSDDKTKTINASLASARSEMESYSKSNKVASEFKVTSSELANIDKATDGYLTQRVADAFHKASKEDADVAAAYARNSTEFSNVGGAANADTIRMVHALNSGNDASIAALASALGNVGNLGGTDINGNHIKGVNPNVENVRATADKELVDAKNLSGKGLPTAASIIAENNTIRQKTGSAQENIDAAAHTQPKPYGGGTDFEAQQNAEGNKVMAQVQESNVKNNIQPRYPIDMGNGTTGKIVIDDSIGGKLITDQGLASRYLQVETANALAVMQQGGKLTDEQRDILQYAKENPSALLHPSSLGGGSLAMAAQTISGRDDVVKLHTVNATGDVAIQDISVHDAGKMQFNHLRNNKGNDSALSGVQTISNDSILPQGEIRNNQNNHSDNIDKLANELSNIGRNKK